MNRNRPTGQLIAGLAIRGIDQKPETVEMIGALLGIDHDHAKMPVHCQESVCHFTFTKMVKTKGVESAIEWFRTKGRKAAWGGANQALAKHLIEDGRVDDGLRLMELDIELTPGKVWLLRKTAEACLSNGRPKKALVLSNKGLKLRSDDEGFATIMAEAEQDIQGR